MKREGASRSVRRADGGRPGPPESADSRLGGVSPPLCLEEELVPVEVEQKQPFEGQIPQVYQDLLEVSQEISEAMKEDLDHIIEGEYP